VGGGGGDGAGGTGVTGLTPSERQPEKASITAVDDAGVRVEAALAPLGKFQAVGLEVPCRTPTAPRLPIPWGFTQQFAFICPLSSDTLSHLVYRAHADSRGLATAGCDACERTNAAVDWDSFALFAMLVLPATPSGHVAEVDQRIRSRESWRLA